MPVSENLIAIGLPPAQAEALGFSNLTTVTATGTSQVAAASIKSFVTQIEVTTSAGNTGVRLPDDADYQQDYLVINPSIIDAQVYPPIGSSLNDLTVNVPIAVGTNVTAIFSRLDRTRWISFDNTPISGGEVDSINVAATNGFDGSSSGGSTPTLTLTTTETGTIYGDGTSLIGLLGTTTTVLHGNGSGPPTFGKVALSADVSGVLPTANGGTAFVAARVSMASLDTTKFTVAYLSEAGRQGLFQWNSSNLATLVSADTLQGIYVSLASDPTGASGAWVRIYNSVVAIEWFGAAADGSTDSGPGLRCARDVLVVLGGGLIQLGSGTYLISTLRTSRIMEPASNLTLRGEGPQSIIKLGNNVGTAGFFGIAGQNPNDVSNTYNNFTATNFAIDYNGSNNLVSIYSPGIYIAYGSDITIDGLTTLNYPGSQPMALGIAAGLAGNPATPQIFRPIVTNCRFENIGAVVNSAITDSSAIYVDCLDGVVSNNIIVNISQDTIGTGIEMHGTGTCFGNSMDKLGKAYNVGAHPNTFWNITGNSLTDCCNYITVWDNIGTGVFFQTTVSCSNDKFITSQLPTVESQGLVNCGTQTSDSGLLLSVKISDCLFWYTGAAGNASIAPVFVIGHGRNYEFQNNTVIGYPGEALRIGSTTDITATGTCVVFSGNTIRDCCNSGTAGHQTAVNLVSANKLAAFIAVGNFFENASGSAYIVTCFGGTAIPAGYQVTGTGVSSVANIGPSTTSAFTPVLTASVSNPTLGNSTLAGEYEVDGDYCIYRGKLTVGSTFSAGSGTYRFSLPFTPKTTLNNIFGGGLVLQTGIAYLAANSVIIVGQTILQMHGSISSPYSFPLIQSNTPIAWAVGDIIEWDIRYRIV